jgi:uridine kinase
MSSTRAHNMQMSTFCDGATGAARAARRPVGHPSPNQNPPHRGRRGSKCSYRLGMSVLRLDDVIAEVMERTAENGVRIIGVDGPQGSGKSTLAARIAALIGAPLVQMDDFVSWVDLVGWWPRFEAQVLNPLLSGNDAHYQVRDWENDEFGTSLDGWKTVEWSPVVVLEGLTCTRAAVAERLAYRIWVEAPDAVRLRRGLERDGDTHRDLWVDSMTTELEFFTDDATRTRADLRVNGNPDISHDQESEVVLLD